LFSRKNPTTTPDWQAAVRRRTRFYVLMSVLLATLFGFLVFQFFSHQQQIAPGELASAVFADRDIEIGILITSEMLDIRDVSVRAVPASHFSFKEQAVGKVTLYPLVEGEVLLPEKLAGDRDEELPAYVFALDDQEALSLLYARANQFQLLVLLRPAGRE